MSPASLAVPHVSVSAGVHLVLWQAAVGVQSESAQSIRLSPSLSTLSEHSDSLRAYSDRPAAPYCAKTSSAVKCLVISVTLANGSRPGAPVVCTPGEHHEVFAEQARRRPKRDPRIHSGKLEIPQIPGLKRHHMGRGVLCTASPTAREPAVFVQCFVQCRGRWIHPGAQVWSAPDLQWCGANKSTTAVTKPPCE